MERQVSGSAMGQIAKYAPLPPYSVNTPSKQKPLSLLLIRRIHQELRGSCGLLEKKNELYPNMCSDFRFMLLNNFFQLVVLFLVILLIIWASLITVTVCAAHHRQKRTYTQKKKYWRIRNECIAFVPVAAGFDRIRNWMPRTY